MTSYLSFEISRTSSGYLAKRKTKTAIWQLGPRKTLAEIRRRIDEFYFSASFEDW